MMKHLVAVAAAISLGACSGGGPTTPSAGSMSQTFSKNEALQHARLVLPLLKYPDNSAQLSQYLQRTANVAKARNISSSNGSVSAQTLGSFLNTRPASDQAQRADTSLNRVVYIVTRKITSPVSDYHNKTLVSGTITLIFDAASGDLLESKMDGKLSPESSPN